MKKQRRSHSTFSRVCTEICFCFVLSGTSGAMAQQSPGWEYDREVNLEALPKVPAGFEVSFFASEPFVRQPSSMAFDAKGRLYVGMGPQYRNPKPESPGDSVAIVLDDDADFRADRTKIFATGFNAIQGLAWHGRDLWVANAPDLTVVRDLDGDDEADEYIRIYTDLGNLEHGLHGLNWAPDGKLYMSKGNSKGLTQPGRLAPKAFRELWGVHAPAGSPDFPNPVSFKKGEYQKAYHDPADDWGREGGVLRCDDGGHNLEIVSRGMRNPWDITFDSGFNWLGTDNDQVSGDRVFMPFFGAHFGWNHPWSAHWDVRHHFPTAPVSGPMFEGSGTGIVYGDSPEFPASHRGVFFINDWLRKTTFVWRPAWDGALLRPQGGNWEPFAQGGSALFRPTDLEFGPDGALWILGWSSGYGAEYKNGQMTSEGRVFRVAAKSQQVPAKKNKRQKPLEQWTPAELIEDFTGPLPVWRTDAQDELVRRGAAIKPELLSTLAGGGLQEGLETWTAWTLGQIALEDRSIDQWFSTRIEDSTATLNLRVQSLRIIAHRIQKARDGRELPLPVLNALQHSEPRLRFEAALAIGQALQRSAVPSLLKTLLKENDRTVFYAAWQTLRTLEISETLKKHMPDARGGARKGVLLALLENHAMTEPEVRALANDEDAGVREVATLWLQKASAGADNIEIRGRPLNTVFPEAAQSVPSATLVRNVKTKSGARYALMPGGLRTKARPYTDRAYELTEVPDGLLGVDFIQTSNEDDGSRGDAWLQFEMLMPARIHVALDTRANAPSWLRKDYRLSTNKVRADHWTFQLYTREFPAGSVELGGNTDDGRAGGKGNYIVLVEPLPIVPPNQAATIDSSLSLLPKADAQRGEWLFHSQRGAGCFSCHRLNEQGNNFGPDLNALGARATPRHIVQSLLEPNAVITEGFNLQTVETGDAEYSGTLIEESGLSLTLGLATGQRQVIPKSSITRRQIATTSAMPSFATTLSDQYAADLAAYLLAQNDIPKNNSQTGDGPKTDAEVVPPSTGLATSGSSAEWPKGSGFRVAHGENRILIAHNNQPVAEFVFRDEKTLRPYFANVHAPSGFKVTRNHPPIPGLDDTDHETMHPGIWLAFGDVSGTDFWRNTGRIEHVQFIQPPAVTDGRLTFATECRLLDASGLGLCSLTNRFTLAEGTNAWMLTWDATFYSPDREVTFGDQEEMGFGARVATAISEKRGGIITASSGLATAKNTWGQAAEWCDYSKIIDGQRVGITLMADPKNFRPSWWHNRDYGVFVANPFGRAAMKQGPPSSVVLKKGEQLRMRFGALIHSASPNSPGPEPAAAYRHWLHDLPTILH